jgi:hypothetical protein
MTTILGKIRLLCVESSTIEEEVLESGRVAYVTNEATLVVGDGETTGSGLQRFGLLQSETAPTLGADLNLNGHKITTVGSQGIAIGINATSEMHYSLAIGDFSRASNASVALGLSSITESERNVSVGSSAYASGIYATAIGAYSIANIERGFASGFLSLADRYGMRSHSIQSVDGWNAGASQLVDFQLSIKTTNNTPATLMLDGASKRLTIPNGKAFFGNIMVVGILSTGAKACMYMRKFAIKNVSNTVSLIGTVETIGTDIEDDADYDIGVTADDTNKALQINVTGKNSETIRWMAHVSGLELAYGT